MRQFESIKDKLQVKINEGFSHTARLGEVEKEREELIGRMSEMTVQCQELEVMLGETSVEIVEVEKQKQMYMNEAAEMREELARVTREREEEKVKEEEKKKSNDVEAQESSHQRKIEEMERAAKEHIQAAVLQESLDSHLSELAGKEKDNINLTACLKEKDDRIEELMTIMTSDAETLRDTEVRCTEALVREELSQRAHEAASAKLQLAEESAVDLERRLKSLLDERDEYERVKEKTKQTVATVLEKLKHFKSLSEQKVEEALALGIEVERLKGELLKATENIVKIEEEIKQKEIEILRKEEVSNSQSTASGMMSKEFSALEMLVKEKEEQIAVFQADLKEHVALTVEKEEANLLLKEEMAEMKITMNRRTSIFEKLKAKTAGLNEAIREKDEQLNDLRAKLDESASIMEKNEKYLSLAQEDLSVLSLRYVQSQEEKTAAIATAAEEKAAALRHREEKEEMKKDMDREMDRGKELLGQAVSAVEDRDARLSSYADHVEGLDIKLRNEETLVAQLRSDVQNAVDELLQVTSLVSFLT